ncbi:hypothetical protein FQV27_05495 [Paracoccus aurantiacus]|uniref:Type IV secretion protein Rhs n=1 Tax=Paracoccus aurantiacus TaxID=2599412 RepID=A0A5C6S5M1_9RHOB|nr:RHS repeat-associated core domain-containing protein [Paracoccus aurantiacus]TXB69577.1 hypothetical protein FQV27_05495 [Paracoccus aurantiacus]
MPAALAAAHIGHEIEHSSAMMGFLIGAALGLAAAVALVAVIGTGGAALGVIAAAGGIVAATGGGALTGMRFGQLAKSPKGPISTGSPNVFYGPSRIAAARAIIDTVDCKNHGKKRLATGSDSVFLNEYPAVRTDDVSECDGTVKSDFDNIFIGAETAQYLEIQSEVPQWMVDVAMGMVIVGGAVALTFGAAAAFAAGGLCSLMTFGANALGGMLGSAILAPIGGQIGEALFGEAGGVIGEELFGMIGGGLGGRFANGFRNRVFSGHPVDVASGELYTRQVDFTISGLIEIDWARIWLSSSSQNGALGRKWHHPLDMALAPAENCNVLRLEEGRLILLPKMETGQSFYHRAEKLVAICRGKDDWVIRRQSGLEYRLGPVPGGEGRLRLDLIADANGNRIALDYDGAGNLIRVTGADEIAYLFTHDEEGRFLSVARSDAEQQQILVRYHYGPHGDLTAIADAVGAETRHDYRNHLMVRETLRGGLSYHFEWDDVARGTEARCIRTWGDGDLHYREFQFDPDLRITRSVTGTGAVEIFGYDRYGLVTHVTGPSGQQSEMEYNRFAELLVLRDATGAETRWQHDEFGRPVETTDRAGAATRLDYASDDPLSRNFMNVALEQDALGHATEREYDARGNLVQVTDPLGYSIHILRDQRGLTLNIQDAEGTLRRYSWGKAGYLKSERTPAGGTVSYEYDRFWRLARRQVEGVEPVTYDYDPCDRVVQVMHAAGSRISTAYNADGNVAEVRDAKGAVWQWDWRGLSLPVTRRNPDGTRLQYDYDTEMRLTALTNEVGDSYRLEYDGSGNVVVETAYDGRRMEYGYDLAGQLVTVRDGYRHHSYQRDAMGRLILRESSDGGWARYEYDLLGRMTLADNPSRKLRYVHDPLGHVLSEVQDGAELLHSYSDRGLRTTTILPDGRFIRYGHDANNALAAVHYGDRQIVDIRRDRIGRELRRQGGAVTRETEYDPQGRIRRQAGYRSAARQPVFARGYSYDSVSNITSIGSLTNGETVFGYDQRNRLRSASSDDHEERFGFDPANTVLIGVDNPRDASVQHGRLMMRGDCHYEYDDAGNRIAMRRGQGGSHQFRYVYNDDNRLIEVDETRGRTRRRTRFAYDALGRRVSKSHHEVIAAANAPGAPGTDSIAELVRDDVTWFLWDGPVLLAEGRGDASGPADPLAVVYVHEPETFRPAAQIRRHSAEEEARVLLYWLDHLGTPQEVSNENGELVWQVSLKAWGGVDRVLVDRVEQNLRFQGQYHDEETGLHYNRFRHYDPAAGIYLNQDPLGLLGGANVYAYPTDPLSGTDPYGLVEPSYPGAGGQGYVVYGLGEFDSKGNLVRTVYVGQTEATRYTTRMQEHRDSNRLHGGLREYEITRVQTYGEARGAEQYHIENSNGGAGTLRSDQFGAWADEGNNQRYGPGFEGNRVDSYSQDRVRAGDPRAVQFDKGYQKERSRVTATTRTCS